MKKVKTFFYVFEKSLFLSFDYYKKIIHTKFSFSFKYFLSLILFFNLFFIFTILLKHNPVTLKSSLVSLNQSLINLPNDFQIKIIKGNLIYPYPYPYFFWLDKPKKLLLVIDEFAEPSKINIYNSLILFTRNEAVINSKLFNKNLNNYIFSFKNIQYQKINKENILSFIKFNNLFIKFFYFIYLFLILIIFILSFLTVFILLNLAILIESFLVYIIFKYLIKKKITYKKIVQIGLHIITIPITIHFFISNFLSGLKLEILNKIPFFVFPLLFIFIIFTFNFVGVCLVYLKNKKNNIV